MFVETVTFKKMLGKHIVLLLFPQPVVMVLCREESLQ